MIDIRLIRQEPDAVKAGLLKKHADVNVDEIVDLDSKYRGILTEVESLRAERKALSKEYGKLSQDEMQEKSKEIKTKLQEAEETLAAVENKRDLLLLQVPNLPDTSVPEGADESENVVAKKVGEPRVFSFMPLEHQDLGKQLDIIDTERATKVSGSRFYYLKGKGALLEMALVRFTFDILGTKGFMPIITPVLVREDIMRGGGYLPGGEEEIYTTEKDNLYLIGTSEQSILGLHTEEVFADKELPKRYAGFSSCFRREAGSYGKDVKGIFRVHQFDKVEMFSFCLPEDAEKEHELILAAEEEIMQTLGIPYQVVLMCAGDLGAPAAKKFDIEAWMPGQNRYRETHSCSNCTDFQARRLNIRFRREGKGATQYAYTLNGTAVALGRMIVAILENFQQADGSIVIPEALGPYTGFDTIEAE